jgi:acetoin utilization deacetylase AcuC-like enzyme
MDEFKPELIVLSAGFDAFVDDPVQCLRLVEADYAFMSEEIKALAVKHCQGRLISVLEGGYDLDSLQRCVQVHLTHLMTGCALDSAAGGRTTDEANNNARDSSEISAMYAEPTSADEVQEEHGLDTATDTRK